AMNDKTNALVAAHLSHVLAGLQSLDVIAPEVDALMDWLATQSLGALLPLERLQRIARAQALDLPLTERLRNEIVQTIQTALDHPANANTTVADLVPSTTATAVIDYLSNQRQHREALIHEIFSNPAYATMLSQTISHAISDYMENNVLSKKMGMGGLMKLGKSVIEKATDSNLDDALQQYLNKNINGLIGVSERMANKHLNDTQVKGILTQAWQKISKKPVTEARRYAPAQTVADSAVMISDVWDHLRQTPFIQVQVETGLAAWHSRNADRNLIDLLSDVNVTPDTIRTELKDGILTIIKAAIDSGYVSTRIEALLRQFYESAEAQAILA
ncbi:MAG: hypothetical protein RLY58_2457, partial [Pseudomonadota bacterium]